MNIVTVIVSTPHGRAVPLELVPVQLQRLRPCWFQPLMGEPSLWNYGWRLQRRNYRSVSTPHGRAVPLEPSKPLKVDMPAPQRFNPSWESRPSGTKAKQQPSVPAHLVSTPPGRAVPLELSPKPHSSVFHI